MKKHPSRLIPGERIVTEEGMFSITRVEPRHESWWITGTNPDRGTMLFVRLDSERVEVEA